MKEKKMTSPGVEARRLKPKGLGRGGKDQIQLCLLLLPALVMLIIFKYLPMGGIVIAFKDYKYSQGIFGSAWAGLENFEFFFKSNDARTVIRNALLYNITFIITGHIISIAMAITLTNIKSKKMTGVFQTLMFQPYYLSWVVIAFISLTFLSYKNGLFNTIVENMGGEAISWYGEPKYWPFILWFFHMWKGQGYQILLYYTSILGIDESIYEAAKVDGCSTMQTAIKITVPMLVPTMTILMIMAIGAIFNSDFGLFYQIPQGSGALQQVTDVIETYTYRALTEGSMSISSAVGLTQSVVGLILVVTANAVVKKYSAENALF